jgi:hypothetical protein
MGDNKMTKPTPGSLKDATAAVAHLWWWADVTIEVEEASKAEALRWREANKAWAANTMVRR